MLAVAVLVGLVEFGKEQVIFSGLKKQKKIILFSGLKFRSFSSDASACH
jgi:hypothetical protein